LAGPRGGVVDEFTADEEAAFVGAGAEGGDPHGEESEVGWGQRERSAGGRYRVSGVGNGGAGVSVAYGNDSV